VYAVPAEAVVRTSLGILVLLLMGASVLSTEARADVLFQVSPDGRRPTVALRSDGSIVVIWIVSSPPKEIRGRLFRSDGVAIGAEFTVSDTEIVVDDGAFGTDLALGVAPDDSFVVAYRGFVEGSFEDEIRVRQFAPSAQPLGASTEVSIVGNKEPVLAMRADGGFVIAFPEALFDAVYARTYNADGNPTTGIFQTIALGSPWNMTVNQNDTLLFVRNLADPANSMTAQPFDLAGNVLAPPTEFAPAPAGGIFPVVPFVAAGSDGNFLAVWAMVDQTVHARRISETGQPLGSAFELTQATPPDEGPFAYSLPDVESHPDGGYVVSWQTRLGVEAELWARRVSTDGTLFREPIVVRPTSPGWLNGAFVGAGPARAFAVVWIEPGGGGILVHSFAAAAIPAIALWAALALAALSLVIVWRRAGTHGASARML
jgi:hypothetical protein